MALACTGKKASRRRQYNALGNVLLGNIGSCHSCGCYFETSIVADHVHPFMETVFPDGSGIFQWDNAPCHQAKMVINEWFA